MPEGKLQRLVEVYSKGREIFTRKSYKSSFGKLGGLCRECDLSRPPFSLGTRGHCPHVISILAGDFVEILYIFEFFI
jgi:hypothetical protein